MRTEFSLDEVDELFDEDGVAICSSRRGHVKPDVVLFGEFPADAMAEAEALASRADLMLCIGSSLEVFPVAGLPTVTLGRGGRLAVITQGPTPFDQDAAVRMDGDVVADLGGPRGPLGLDSLLQPDGDRVAGLLSDRSAQIGL